MKNERALIKRLRRADTDAFREFYERMLDPLYRYVYFRAREDHDVTQDIVHDTFLRAIRSLNGFSPGKGSLQAWLCGIARNCLHEHGRRVGRQAEAVRSLRQAQSNRSDAPGPLPQDVGQDVKARVNCALALLPKLYTRTLVRKYVDRKSVREIAQSLGKSEKAVESLLSRARKAFRQHFREDLGDRNSGRNES